MNQPLLITPIGNYVRSEDARNVEETRILGGRNFLFDSFGPKSGLATKELSPFPIGLPVDVQGIRLEGRAFVFSGDAILQWRTSIPYMWEPLISFESVVPGHLRDPWAGIFLGGSWYFAQRSRGLYQATEDENTGRLRVFPRTDTQIPGLIEDIRHIDVVRNRPIIVSDSIIQWGNVGELDTLAPSLSGPGFANIADYTKGTFVGMTSFNEGFVVYTTEGSIIVEFIGGDQTWRFRAGTSTERPLNTWCSERLSNGANVFLGTHGLMVAGAGREPTPWTPEFNEYFREYIVSLGPKNTTFRLEYDSLRERVYVLESGDSLTYWRSMVIVPTLDKWGELSERHYGILYLNPDDYGYVDTMGIARVFNESFVNQVEPDNSVGANRHYPRLEKTLPGISSTTVSRHVAWETEYPLPGPEVPSASWYYPNSTIPAPLGLAGLDSWIEFGYVRPGQMTDAADSYIEIHEILLGSTPSAAPEMADFTTDWKPGYFYGEFEDWHSEGVYTPGNLTVDLDLIDGARDLESAPNYDHLDLETLDYPSVVFNLDDEEDWNEDGIAEDWGGPISGLPILTYGLTLQSSLDGITFDEFTPIMARFMTEARLFSVFSTGAYHRFRVEANEPFEFYHVKLVSLTIGYGGQVI